MNTHNFSLEHWYYPSKATGYSFHTIPSWFLKIISTKYIYAPGQTKISTLILKLLATRDCHLTTDFRLDPLTLKVTGGVVSCFFLAFIHSEYSWKLLSIANATVTVLSSHTFLFRQCQVPYRVTQILLGSSVVAVLSLYSSHSCADSTMLQS